MTENDTENTIENVAETEEDRKIGKAERLLAGLKPEWTVTIHRVMPSWCKGWLERIDLMNGGVDIPYIVRTWGGQLLRLRICDSKGQYKGGVDLPLYTHQPKKNGRVITPHDCDFDNVDPPQQQQPIVLPQTAPQQNPLDIVGILGLLQETRKEDLDTVRALLGTAAPAVMQKPSNPMDDMLKFATKFKQLQEAFGGFGQQPTPSEDGDILGTVKEIAKGLQFMRPQPAISAPSVPPQPQRPQPRVVPPQNNPPKMPPQPQLQPQQPNPPNPNALPMTLSGLEPEQFRDLMLTSLAIMPDNQRERTTELLAEAAMEYGDDDEDYEEISEQREPSETT